MKIMLCHAKQQPVAFGLHVVYWLGWAWVAGIVKADHSHLDACGRGTITVYPVLVGMTVSVLYALALLGLLAFKRAKQPCVLLLVGAVAAPVLLLAF